MKKLIILGFVLICMSSCSTRFNQAVPTEELEIKRDEKKEDPPSYFEKEKKVLELPEIGLEFIVTDLVEFEWLSDSERLIGAIFSPVGIGAVYQELYYWDPGGNTYTQISRSGFSGSIRCPQRNPSNENILYGFVSEHRSSTFSKKYPTGLYLASIEGGLVDTQYVFETIPGTWTADGKNVVTEEFSVLEIDTGEIQALEDIEQFERMSSLSLSPHGSYLAFSGRKVFSDPNELFLVLLENGETIRLGGGSYVSCISWSPDEEWLLFESSAPIAYNLKTLCHTDMLKVPYEIHGYRTDELFGGLSWSPDGTKIAIGGLVTGFGYGIFILDVEGELIQDWLSSGTCE